MEDTRTRTDSNNGSSNVVLSKNSGFRVRGTKSSSIRSNNRSNKGPSLEWLEGVASLTGTTLFLMARQGPTVFVVKDESGAVYKVVVGVQHRCSCRSENKGNRYSLPVIEESGTSSNGSTTNSEDAILTNNHTAEDNTLINNTRDDENERQKAANERLLSNGLGGNHSNVTWCKHLLFCLIKVLKIPKEHPLCYQNGLSDSEIDQVLNYGLQSNAPKPIRLRSVENKFNDDIDDKEEMNSSYVVRQSIAESNNAGGELDSCPICQDDMIIDQCLTWCRTGCGNNMHAKCMLQYCQFKTSNHQQPGCPLCRENWNMDLLQKDCQSKDKKKVSAPGKSKRGQNKSSKLLLPLNCSNCTCLVRNVFHRCLECSLKSFKTSNKTVDLCGECFNRISHGPSAASGVHASHRFVASTAALLSINEVHWAACKFPIHGNMSATYSQQQLEEREAVIASIQNTLAERELTMNDYELLLNLDGGGTSGGMPEISNLLVDSLPMVKSSSKVRIYQATNRCWCESQSSSTQDAGNQSFTMKKLSCEHAAHEKCLKKELLELLTSVDTSAFNGAVLCGFCCRHSGCESKVFPHLNRRKEATSAATVSTSSTLPPSSDFSPTNISSSSSSSSSSSLSGGGLHITGIAATNNNISTSSSSASTSRSQPNDSRHFYHDDSYHDTSTNMRGPLPPQQQQQQQQQQQGRIIHYSSISAGGVSSLGRRALQLSHSRSEEAQVVGLHVTGLQSSNNNNNNNNSNINNNSYNINNISSNNTHAHNYGRAAHFSDDSSSTPADVNITTSTTNDNSSTNTSNNINKYNPASTHLASLSHLRRPPRPRRAHPPPNNHPAQKHPNHHHHHLQPLSLLHPTHLLDCDSGADSDPQLPLLLPQVVPSRLNSKHKQPSSSSSSSSTTISAAVAGSKSPLKLPSMMGLNTSVEYNGNKLSNINNSSSNNNISCSSSAVGLLRSGSEKRIQVNNRGGNNSNVKKVGEILLQRIFNHDNDNGEHNNNAAINSSSSIIDGGVIGNGGNLKDYTPIGNDYGNDLSSLAVHSVPLGRKASSSRLIANNGEEYLSDMDGDVSNMPSRYSSGGGGGRLKKGISNIQPMQHGDKHRQTSRSDHNLLSVSNAKHYNNDGNEAT